MKKICVIGGPSSGKTTATLLLGVCLKMMGYEVHFVLEYATHYINRNGAPTNIFEQGFIFQGQRHEEGYIERSSKCDFLICDAASFLACVYTRHFRPSPGATENELKKYNYVLKTLDKWAREQTLPTYDFIFFLPSEIPFQKNSVRWQNNIEEAKKIADQIEGYLKVEGRQYYRITGSLIERTLQILEILGIFPSEEIKGILKILEKIFKEAEEKEKNFKIFPLIE